MKGVLSTVQTDTRWRFPVPIVVELVSEPIFESVLERRAKPLAERVSLGLESFARFPCSPNKEGDEIGSFFGEKPVSPADDDPRAEGFDVVDVVEGERPVEHT